MLGLVTLTQGADLLIGRAAPPLSLSNVLQAPDGQTASWSALRGKAEVIEFWATWCGGCREIIAHLNELEGRFRGRFNRFLSLTDEDPGLVSRFLKEHPISGWVGIDSEGKTVREYGIVGWPRTVLVDARGVIQGIGNPAALTTELLEDFLAGRPMRFSQEV